MGYRLLRSGFLPFIALGSLALAGASIAQPGGGGQPPTQQPGRDGPRRGPGEGGGPPGQGGSNQSANQAMKGINRAARMLKDQIGDASKKDENLKLIWAMERNVVQAKTQEPEVFAASEKAKLLPQYRKDLNELLRMMLKMEEEVADGKTEEAGKTFAAIGQKRDAEHEKFKVKD